MNNPRRIKLHLEAMNNNKFGYRAMMEEVLPSPPFHDRVTFCGRLASWLPCGVFGWGGTKEYLGVEKSVDVVGSY